jgi:hypothetical protein
MCYFIFILIFKYAETLIHQEGNRDIGGHSEIIDQRTLR